VHILVAVAGLGAGGAERVIALITAAWVNEGREVTVVAFDAPGDPVYHGFDPAVRIVRLGPFPRGRATVALKTWRLRAAIRQLRPDVTIGFLTKVNAMLLLATIGLGTRVAVAERNNPRRQNAHRGWTLLLNRLYRRADAIVLQTEASRECLPLGVAPSAYVIPNPIVAAQVAPTRAHKTIVGVGRLDAQKGFDRLIDAFASIARRHSDWQLVIWGEGPCRSLLAGRIAELGLSGRVALPGLSEVPRGWTQSAGIFALSSHFEGFPNALGEAMAAALPVVAFDCPYGPREMISDGVDGLLVPADDVAAFAAALDRLVRDVNLRQHLGTAAQGRIAEFNPDHVVAKWSEMVEHIARRLI
jgi:glycosyltransferase involved in cell wall biosynthesis